MKAHRLTRRVHSSRFGTLSEVQVFRTNPELLRAQHGLNLIIFLWPPKDAPPSIPLA